MKISVACIFICVYSVFYFSLGTSVTDNNEVHLTSANLPENTTNNDDDAEDIEGTNRENSIESSINSHSNAQKASNTEESSDFKHENDFLDVAQNSGVAHEITNPSLEIIHTLVDTPTLELQDKADELSIAPISETSHFNSTSSLEDNFVQEARVDKDIFKEVESLNDFDDSDIFQTEQFIQKVPIIEPKINATDKSEEIPSFSEWTQKQLEEAERKKEEVNASLQNQFSNGKYSLGGKKRWKNYASPDCGAKIIAANPEAVSPGSVLSPSRDEYKLNTCTSRIWFIVELCEAIQAKKIDLANFELFSSSPKDFSIYVSDRFTTRDWSNVGHFTANDERDIQSFDLHPHLFGKFIKFEMHSHYGSEHYCPISLFRVYGTSEFEVLETENQVHAADDDDDDETLELNDGDPPKNLFSSATDAVMSIVKKAAEALGNKGNCSKTEEYPENKTTQQYLPLVNSCTTPSHMIICENCSDLLFGYVYELLSCKSKELHRLIKRPFIKKTLYHSNICLSFGLEWRQKPSTQLPDIYKKYMWAFFAPKYIAAMCNIVAINECKVVLNVSQNATIITQNMENITSGNSPEITNPIFQESTPQAVEESSSIINTATSDIPESTLSKPSITLPTDENLNVIDSSDNTEEKPPPEPSKETIQNNINEDSTTNDDHVVQEIEQVDLNSVVTSTDDSVPENSESLEDALYTLVNEINEESTPTVPAATASPPVQPQQQKESVFLRLSNRLKALELNMSLSGQYLEELSRRYKKQVEEMQRLLDKTILTLNEDNRKKDERAEYLELQINSLKDAVESLMAERNSWISIMYWLIFILTITATTFFCKGNTNNKQPTTANETKNSENMCQKSIGIVTQKMPMKKKRRSSEEVLLIGGTYKELLITNSVEANDKSKDKKRKRRRPKLYKSNSVSTFTEEIHDKDNHFCKTDSYIGLDFAPKLTSSRILNQQAAPELSLPLQVIKNSTHMHNQIQDIPFTLEENEHSALESLPDNSLANEDSKPKQPVVAVNSSLKGASRNSNHSAHKKSASFDNSKMQRQSSSNESSANGSLLDKSLVELPRREKRNFLKRIFKNLTIK